MGEKICVCLRRGECVPFCRVAVASLVAWLCCVVYLAACKMWVCVWVGRAVVVGGNLSYFCLLPANLRGGRVVTEPLEVLLPVGNVVSGVYIVCALFEYKKWIFSVYIVYAFFYFLPAGLPAGVCVWQKMYAYKHMHLCCRHPAGSFFVYTLSYAYHFKF